VLLLLLVLALLAVASERETLRRRSEA
jgi:Tfp pilus assembly protein PilX